MDCFKCGSDEHLYRDCPELAPRRRHAPAAAWPSAAADERETPQPPPVPPRRDPDPPTPVYLQARAALLMPLHTAYIQVECPWCGAGVLKQCVNPGTGLPRPPHDARAQAAGLPPADGELRAMAAEQAAEYRAARPVV